MNNCIKYIAAFICLFSNMSCTPVTKVTTVTFSQNNNDKRYYLPVKVNGTEFLFLIDTGAQYTIIDYNLAKKIGIEPIDSSFHTITTNTYRKQDTIYWGMVDLQIGDIELKNKITLDGYKSFLLNDSLSYDKCDGILGVDVLEKYNWLFDFETKKLCISNRAIKDSLMTETLQMSLDIVGEKGTITTVELLLNDSLKEEFLFDTGYPDIVNIGDYHLHGIFEFSDSLSYILNKHFPNNLTISLVDNVSLMLMKDLQVNNMPFSYISATHKNYTLQPNRVNVHLLSLFRLMYYDKINRKINFYLPRTASCNEEHLEDTELLHKKITRLSAPNSKVESTWDNLFLKHDSVTIKNNNP